VVRRLLRDRQTLALLWWHIIRYNSKWMTIQQWALPFVDLYYLLLKSSKFYFTCQMYKRISPWHGNWMGFDTSQLHRIDRCNDITADFRSKGNRFETWHAALRWLVITEGFHCFFTLCTMSGLYFQVLKVADPRGRVGLRPPACWNCGFQSRRRLGYLSLLIVVCCQVEVSATGWSLV
jgi:hypothetical protein